MNLYSQYGEDRQITNIVKDCANRRLLDIGAYHPKQFSNSRALLESGWTGVLVEPSPEPFLTLLKEYANWPGIQLVNAPVSPTEDWQSVLMHATADAVSTTSEAVRALWAKQGGYYGSFYTPQISVANLVAQFGIDFEFVNVDTEGSSVDVFGALMRAGARPKCVCVEHDERVQEANRYASSCGYRQVLLNGTNVLYAR